MKKIIKSFRKTLAKIVFDKSTRKKEVFEIKGKKSFLFLRNDNKIGDMVVSTLIFREIKEKYPDIKVSILCGKDNKDIIKFNPYADDIIEINGSFLKDLNVFRSLRNRKFDLAVDFYVFRQRPANLFMLRTIDPGYLIGFHKENYNMYDMSINCDINEMHISKRYELLLNAMGIEPKSLKYDIFLGNEFEEKASKFFKQDVINMIINPFAASKHRSFSPEKLQNLIFLLKNEKIKYEIYILCGKSMAGFLNGIKDAKIISTESVLESAAYIKYCSCVITPDTSIVHIASAFGKKTVALYQDYSMTKEKIDKIWAPAGYDSILLNADTKNGKLENDIENIDNEVIVSSMANLLAKED